MAINFDHTANGNVTIKTTSTGTVTLILPSANGLSDYSLITDGTGNLSFSGNSTNIAVAAYGQANTSNTVAIANVNYVNTAMQAAFAAVNIATANVNYVNTAMQAAFAKANTGGSGGSGVGISEAIAANVSNSAVYYITFVNANTGSFANVNVSSRLTFNANTGSLTVSNTVFATHFDNVSDITLKENVKPLQNTIITLNKLNPVSFTWKKDGTTSFGLIAQEVEKIIPEIVHMTDNETKTVSYVQIISFLISALQDQQAQIDDINRRLNA